jgi:hypothetical protein
VLPKPPRLLVEPGEVVPGEPEDERPTTVEGREVVVGVLVVPRPPHHHHHPEPDEP